MRRHTFLRLPSLPVVNSFPTIRPSAITARIFPFFIQSVSFFVPGNTRVLFDYKKLGIGGAPDSLTVDSEGYVWLACNGAYLVRIGDTLGIIIFLCSNICCSTIFGLDYDSDFKIGPK